MAKHSTGVVLTESLARASGQDAGNAQMRKAGRTRWNEEDWNHAAETMMRFMVLGEMLPVQCYTSEFGPFPYVMGNQGTWISLQEAA